ncbi:hypothetical protein [Dyella subtropica]|uniref:hypothetical protein n=1 Tax=Dyella subtropica TaxID=2992127 RepID=UPI00224F304B|nr:hypothetical protein [Dyella subtropica]
MQAAPTYQIAFKFQFKQGFTQPQQVQINIVDSNNFVMVNGEQVQLQPYLALYTPPLSNFNISKQQMFLNIANGEGGEGMQGLAWATFTSGSSAQTLTLNLQAQTGLISTTYAVLGTSSSGVLSAGQNIISVSQ